MQSLIRLNCIEIGDKTGAHHVTKLVYNAVKKVKQEGQVAVKWGKRSVGISKSCLNASFRGCVMYEYV